MASRKRIKASHDVQAEIKSRRDKVRKSRGLDDQGNLPPNLGGYPRSGDIEGGNRYWSNPVVNSTEADRFSKFEADGYNIPLTYDPTKTSWPGNGWDHARTVAAGYDRITGILRVKFYTDGSVYDYGINERVPESIAYLFRLTNSPGRFINDYLENYGYLKVS